MRRPGGCAAHARADLTTQLDPYQIGSSLLLIAVGTFTADLACITRYFIRTSSLLEVFLDDFLVCGPIDQVKINNLHEAVRVTGLMTDANS